MLTLFSGVSTAEESYGDLRPPEDEQEQRLRALYLATSMGLNAARVLQKCLDALAQNSGQSTRVGEEEFCSAVKELLAVDICLILEPPQESKSDDSSQPLEWLSTFIMRALDMVDQLYSGPPTGEILKEFWQVEGDVRTHTIRRILRHLPAYSENVYPDATFNETFEAERETRFEFLRFALTQLAHMLDEQIELHKWS